MEVYFPFFFKNTSSFFEIFSNYEYTKFEDLNSEINRYKNFIHERFNDDLNDMNRPLIKPNHLFTDIDEITSKLEDTRFIRKDVFKSQYDDVETLIDNLQDVLLHGPKYVVMTSNADDLEDLKNQTSTKLDVISSISVNK